jgi:Pectinacetylesterase
MKKIHQWLFASWLAVYPIASCSPSSSSPDGGVGNGSSSSGGGGSSGTLASSGSSGSGVVEGQPGDAGSSGDQGEADSSVAPDNDGSCAALNSTQTNFVNLAPPMGDALDHNENDPVPGADAGMSVPAGWNFYNIAGAMCRDGSPMGIYVRYGSVSKLMIYLEGGGACMSPHFCDHNPPNMNQVFPGGSSNGESFAGSLVTVAGLQAPYTDGIFDNTNPANPFLNWSQVYIPYCTGDAHFGTNPSAQLADGVNPFQMDTWHFVGYLNMQKFIGRLVPTFPSVDQVVLTGSSAGGLGAGLNYGMVQDAFGKIPVTLVDDSFPPFTGTQDITPCLQATVRPLWGLDQALPSDCAECSDPDGGIANIVPYWMHKYPNIKLGLISSIHDQIIRLFLSAGQNNCSDTDPNLLSGLALEGSDVPSFDGGQYNNGLNDLRSSYLCTGKISSYYIGTGDPDASDSNGTIDTLHEHIFRPRFYDPLGGPGQPTLAQWMGDVVGGKIEQVGP